MHIGYDVSSLIYHRGVSRYTANLIRALSTLGKDELYGFGNSFRAAPELIELAKKAGIPTNRITVTTYPQKVFEMLWQWNRLPVSHFHPQLDLFHSWDWLQPPDTKLPLVSTIHDLAILKFPETAHPSVVAHHQRSWDILKQREARIIAVSQSTKTDIVTHLNIPADRIHVVYEALPLETVLTSQAMTEARYQKSLEKLQLSKPFILAVGTREPRKNLERLIQAWQPLAKEVDMLIAGETGWDGSAKFDQPELRLLGKVSSDELHVLYEEAQLLAYPSLDEGFGLPILEAFHHGTPVVTSNLSAMPEVAGNAAELVDPLSVESIRHGLKTVLEESTVAQQRRLQKMIIRLHAFSWHQVALETRKVYQYYG